MKTLYITPISIIRIRSQLLQLRMHLFLTLVLSLPLMLHAQSSATFQGSYSRPHLWKDIHIVPTYNGNPIYSPGDIYLDDGEVVFSGAADRSDKRLYRKLGAPLDRDWLLDIDFTPIAGGPRGTGHVLVGLTAGIDNPYNEVPQTIASSSQSFAHTDQDGLFLEYTSAYNAPPSQYYLRIRAKDGSTYHTPSASITLAPDGNTKYLRLQSTLSGSLVLYLYSDPERSNLVNAKTISVPSTIKGLNVIQHSTIPQGSYHRQLTARLANLRISDSDQACVRCEDFALNLSDENYVMAKTVRTPVQSTTELNNLTNTQDVWVNVSYLDGLGRAKQEVSVGAAPEGQGDLVEYHLYSEFGRQAITELPYVASGLDGSFRHDGNGGAPINAQRNFYSTSNFPHIPSSDLNVPFAETVFEASPLNRPVEKGAPGADWQVGNNHTIRSKYRGNLANEVYDFGINPTVGSGNPISFFPAGEVKIQETTDEHGTRTWVCTDKLGRVILQQREDPGPDMRTYTIYNEQGLPILVIQPEGIEGFQSPFYGGVNVLSHTIVNDYAFEYDYDDLGRMIRKKVPGADWVELVYNKLDQIVLTQDGNQRPNDEWLFTKYDAQGRPIQSGIFTDPLGRDRAALQSYVDGETDLYEERDGSNFSSWHGYTNFAFPSSGINLLSVTYYDDHDYNRDGSSDVSYIPDMDNFSDHSPDPYTRGMITGVRVWILNPDPDMPASMLTSTFYDKRGREIQTIAENHLHGADISWNEFDFAGQLLFSKTEHVAHDGTGTYAAYERSATVYTSYTHDPQGRLLRTEQKTEDPHNPNTETEFITLSEQTYDKLGQVEQKNLHYKAGEQFLQIGDYQYNIRGWLTQFNDPTASTSSSTYEDLFAFSLSYNSGANAQYNGNISAMSWQTLGQNNNTCHYSFDYDQANRLTAAHYHELDPQGWVSNLAQFSLDNVTYDKNGNLLSLRRRGKTTNGYGIMDELSYSYTANRLSSVSDAGLASYSFGIEQFVDGNTIGLDYSYDANGNMIEDKNKGITQVSYNHLNKPTQVSKGNDYLGYIYAADGTKLRQNLVEFIFEVPPGEQRLQKVTDYVGGFQYEDRDGVASGTTELIFFSHGEGRVRIDNGQPVYEMYLRDHLGNNRVVFTDLNEDGWVDPDPVNGEVLQEEHIYPFGLRMTGASSIALPSEPNQYIFTGKEYQDELGLGWIDFGARMYDPTIGRWNGVDALAEKYVSWSPYNYVLGNPIRFIDPDGNSVTSTFVDSTGKVVLHRDDGDNKVYLVKDPSSWNGGKEGLSIIGFEDPDRTYAYGDQYQHYSPPMLPALNQPGVAVRKNGNSVTFHNTFHNHVCDQYCNFQHLQHKHVWMVVGEVAFAFTGGAILKYVLKGGKWVLSATSRMMLNAGVQGSRYVAAKGLSKGAFEIVVNILSKNQVDEAIIQAMKLNKNPQTQKLLLEIQVRYKRLEQHYRMGILDYTEEYTKLMNEIVRDLIDTIY